MIVKIALLSDMHLDKQIALPERRGDFADIFLLRAVRRLNRFIKPDITVILGDLINQGSSSAARENLQRMKNIVDLLESPSIVLPGNHDGDVDTFYNIFNRPDDHLDVKGVRFVPFIDPDEPGYNARRTEHDLERMAFARRNFNGRLVALQHVPLFPPGQSDCPYNYTNADEIITVMRKSGYCLSLSGHYHNGMQILRDEDISFLAVPALCESPFTFWEVLLDDKHVNVIHHRLQMPTELRLIDRHVHTPYAYCSENMDIAKSLTLAREFGLADIIFTEHSSHLYYDRSSIYTLRHFAENDCLKKTSSYRYNHYFADLEKANVATTSIGLEIDSDYCGRPMLLPEDRSRIHFFIGSVHGLQTLSRGEPDTDKVCDDFLAVHKKFLTNGLDVLAHPFRIFNRSQRPVPEQLFLPMIDLLRKNNVAAEINFHGDIPPAQFFKLCIEAGIKLSLGSDSHNLCDIGEFVPHLELLKTIGYNGDIKDILL